MFARATKKLIASTPKSSLFNASGGIGHPSKHLYSLSSKASLSSSKLADMAYDSVSSPASLKGDWTAQLTKIVSTIGPTSEQLPVLQDLVRNGVRIMRLNFSHATVEEVELRIKNLNLCEGRHCASLGNNDTKNVRAVLLDTRGPEIRMGKLKNDFSGHETISMQAGSTVTLHTKKEWAEAGSTEVCSCNTVYV